MQNSQNNGSKSVIWSIIFSGISATFSAFVTYNTLQIDTKLKDLDAIKKSVEINQAEIAFDRDFKLKIYDLCIEALKQKDQKQEKAAFVAVSSLITTDIKFREGLLGLFSQATDPEIRNAAKKAEFVIREDKSTKTEQPNEKIFVDIFYYQELPQTKDVAQKLFDALKFSSVYELGVNIKPLTKKRNMERFYGVDSTQIRYDESELDFAQKLQSTANQLLNSDNIKVELKQAGKTKPSPGYLSFFVMDAPK